MSLGSLNDPTSSSRRSVTSEMVGRTLWNLISIVTSNVARLVALAIVGQVGGAATLGNVQTAVSAANLAAMAGPTSIGRHAGRSLPTAGAGREGVAKRLLSHGTRLGLILAVMCGTAFVPFFGLRVALATAILTFALCSWTVARGVAVAAGTPLRSMSLVEATGAAVLIIAMVGAVYVEAPWPFYLLSLAALHVPLAATVRWEFRRGVRSESLGDDYPRYVLWGVIGTVASGGLVHLMNVVTNGFGGAEEAGHLAAGLLLMSPMIMLYSALGQVSLPWLSRLLADGLDTDARAKGRQLSTTMYAVVGTVVLILTFLGPGLVRLIFGTDMRVDYATFIFLGAATLAMAVKSGVVALLAARGYRDVRRMAGRSYVGLAAAAAVWASSYAVEGRVTTLSAALGYLVGAAVASILITALGLGGRAAGRAVMGLIAWLVSAYGVTYATGQLGVPDYVPFTLAWVLWVMSSRAGFNYLRGWASTWIGDR